MLSDIVPDQSASASFIALFDAAPSNKSPKLRAIEQRAVLDQRIIDEYWRRRHEDDELARWARDLVTSRPKEQVALTLSLVPNPLVAEPEPVKEKEHEVLDFSPDGGFEKQVDCVDRPSEIKEKQLESKDKHPESKKKQFENIEKPTESKDKQVERNDKLSKCKEKQLSNPGKLPEGKEKRDELDWIKCIDDPPLELCADRDENVLPEEPQERQQSVDELAEGILRNLASIIDEEVASCIDLGTRAFSVQNVVAAQSAAVELSGLHRLKQRYDELSAAWQDGADFPLPNGSIIDAPQLPGLADTAQYLTVRINAVNSAICEALLRHHYDRIRDLAIDGGKLDKLHHLVLGLLPSSSID
jgi:hypothetical protein